MSYDFTNYPLPSEWEQKYDWESKRFFYVDHFKKITTWIDPRIELYKKDHQEFESINENTTADDSLGVLRIPSNRNKPSFSAATSREKKAADIHRKYPEYALSKIIEMLESNYDNVSSVESVFQREIQLKLQREQEEKQKQIEEAAKKAEKEENDKRIKAENEKRLKEETEKRIKEEAEKRIKEATEKRMKEENDKRIKEELSKQRVQLDIQIKNEEERIRQMKEEIKIKAEQLKIEEANKMNRTMDNIREIKDNNVPEEVKAKLNKGPNKTISNGPNPNNQLGSNYSLSTDKREKLAKGPNPANRCGPQINLRLQVSH